ncbi:MAG: hypothetical protein A2289_18850 [Deltaproteobacteria bacterium RIFOXYA12_FULL_58_15]|nr:MAG: hypothetical protein A2289_18850 [Deltaproteobacteria bacterium RIFOXYA12_FULL_58_15]OGR14259.1 MAG: hypothetical protein A2341_13450 [Deltaproteobacteria bacterium RIFOXYB12_FULL_58_9]
MFTLLRVSWRNLWRKKWRTAITVSAITFALTLNVFMISLAEGIYDKMIFDAVRQYAGHITLEAPEYRNAPAVDLVVGDVAALREKAKKLPDVERTKVLIMGQGVAKSADGSVGIALMGVEPSAEASVSPLAHKIEKGSYLEDDDNKMIVIGSTLAERLDLNVGKKLVIATNNIHGDLVEQKLKVKGIFNTGSAEIDGYVVQVPIPFARELYGLDTDQVTQLGIVVADAEKRDAVLKRVRDMVGANVAVHPWEEVMPAVAAYIKLDGGSNYVMQGILLFLTLFTIFNTLLMSVLERTREFAVQLALGTSPLWIRAQIFCESVFIGLLGCAVGLTCGGLLGYYFEVYGLDMASMYGEGLTVSGLAIDSIVHGKVTARTLLTLGGIVVVSIIFTSLFTMRRISRIAVADVLR